MRFFELLHTYARTLRCRQSLGVLVHSKLVSEKLSLRARFTIASYSIFGISFSVFAVNYNNHARTSCKMTRYYVRKNLIDNLISVDYDYYSQLTHYLKAV